jgi:FKBP-type peptidyl-prolyl cis-trans isomerase (trigger factor)
MATLEELQEQVRADIETAKPLTKVIVSGNNSTEVELTDDEYEAMVVSQANDLFDIQENGYKKDRQLAYLPIDEQLDMQYWDKVNGTSLWEEHIAEVKATYPKPSA